MIKLNYKDLESIRPILQERIEGSKIGDRCPIEFIFTVLTMNVLGGRITVYVDKEDDPSAVLILTYAQASVCNETAVIMNLVYVTEKARAGNPRLAIELVNEMFATAEAFAKSKEADVLQAASWIYRGGEDISHLLEKKGFEPQTKEFVKILNHQKQ